MVQYWKSAIAAVVAATLYYNWHRVATPIGIKMHAPLHEPLKATQYSQGVVVGSNNAAVFTITPAVPSQWCILYYTGSTQTQLNTCMTSSNNVFTYSVQTNYPILYSFMCYSASGGLLITPNYTFAGIYTPPGSTYLGCYADAPTRALGNMAQSGGATVVSCYNMAVAQSSTYFALQYGGQCMLGNSGYNIYGTSTACTMTCSDNNVCGGPYANTVYQLNAAPVAPDYTDLTHWKLVWSDEFSLGSGVAIDSNNWVYDNTPVGGNNNDRCTYIHDTSVVHHDGAGNLLLQSTQSQSCNYNCPRITTQAKHYWAYGRFVARIKIPVGTGTWGAFWMYSENTPFGGHGWPENGELDICEIMGRVPNKVYGTAHFLSPTGSGSYGNAAGNQPVLASGTFADNFHVFALEWTATSLKWYYDGTLYYTLNSDGTSSSSKFSYYTAGASTWPFTNQNPFFAILDLAMGGGFDSGQMDCSIKQANMLVDYVRVYQAI